jgi:hypothetical protein
MAFKIKDGLTIGTKIVTDSSGNLSAPVVLNGITLNGATSGTVKFTPPAVAGTQTYELPLAYPAANNYVLTSDTSGNLTWTAGGGGGMTYPGAGIANSTGAAWGTSYTVTGSGTAVVLATSPSISTSLIAGTASFDLLNTTATTINFGGAATTINMGAAAVQVNVGSTTGNSVLTIRGNATAGTAALATNAATATLFNTTATTVNIAGAATAITIGAGTGNTTVNNNLIVTGNLTVQGTTTTVNATTVQVNDKNIELGVVGSPTNVTADGGGITLKGATDKTLNWVNATSAWTSSEDFNLLTGKVFEINGVSVLSATALGTGVTGSSLTSLGTLTGLTVAGASTFVTGAVQLNGVELQLAPVTTARIFKRAIQPTAIAVNTAATIDTFATATYRSAKYTIQVVQGTKYQLSEFRVVHDGTSTYATEYSVLENNSIPVTFTSSIAGGTLSVLATITDAATTSATITIERTLFAV